jgi:hypothetical protein
MTLRNFMSQLRENWPPEEGSCELVEFILSALRAYPHSAALWCWLGNAIWLAQRSKHDFEYTPLECFQNALRADPLCAEAYQEIGFLPDIVDGSDEEACFLSAIECDCGGDAYIGLGDSYADHGRRAEAEAILKRGIEVFEGSVEKMRRALAELQSDD